MINRTYVKYWPAEYHSQSAIDAALQLRRELGGDVSKVKEIAIHTFEASYNIIGKYLEAWAPRTRETADHSLPYCTAVALLDGDVTLAQFDPERFSKPDILALTAKVRVHLDDSLTPRYPRGIPNRIVITLDDGRVLTQEVEFPRGHAMNPMTDGEVESKFRAMVEPRYGREKADRILAACWNLEDLNESGSLIRLVA
jgi:2-methylcitrate dehydratase